jgi:hypothetical protein
MTYYHRIRILVHVFPSSFLPYCSYVTAHCALLTPGRSLPLIFCIHMRSGPIYWGGYLPCKKDYRWWYFTCKKPENIICDGILHVNMFHYFKIPYFTCNFFTKFTYNEYIGPYFLSHIVLRFLPSDLPELLTTHMIVFPDTTR